MRSEDIWALLIAFAPLSLMAFGGNLSVLAPIQQQAVEVHGWLSPREFTEYFAISRSSPGPGAMIVTLIGWKVAGWAGALVATLALYMPSFTLALVVSRVWERYRGRNWHTALQKGLTPIAAGLILAAIVSVLQLTSSVTMVAIALASFGVSSRGRRSARSTCWRRAARWPSWSTGSSVDGLWIVPSTYRFDPITGAKMVSIFADIPTVPSKMGSGS